MILDTLPYRLPALLTRSPRTGFAGVLLLFLFLGAGPAVAQDVIVDDDGQAALPDNCGGSNDVADTIGDGITTNASAGDVVFVCPGTYTETVTVDKSVTLEGNNAGTPGYESRSTETVVDAGTASPVDRTANIAFTIKDDDVTIKGFKLTGNQGVVLDPSRFSATNDGVGLSVQNNLIATDIVGVGIQNVTTTGSKSFTIADNQFELGRQSFDLKDTQEQNLGGNDDDTEGDETFEYTASVAIRTIEGDQSPTIQNNVVTDDGNNVSGDDEDDGSFYGYAIDGLKVTSGPTTIAGDPGDTGNTGTIQGTAQGISILDGQSPRQSNVVIEDFSISAMSGSAPNSGRVNFQAGIFTYTATGSNDGTTDVVIRNTTVEGLDFSDPDGNAGANASANIYLSNFDFGSNNPTHNVTVEGVTIQNTEHRGISLAGTGLFGSEGADDLSVTITDDASGDNTVIKGVTSGNDANGIHSENGGSPTVNNTIITNVTSAGGDAVHVRPASQPATITIGSDVTINSAGAGTIGSIGGSGTEGSVSIGGDVTIDQFSFAGSNASLSVTSGANVTLTGATSFSDLGDNRSSVTLDPAATLLLDGGTYTLSANTRIPSTLEFSNGASVASSTTEHLIVDNTSLAGTGSIQRLKVQNGSTLSSGADITLGGLLTLSSGTFDVSSGSLTLGSTGNTSTAFVSGSGSGTLNGDVTVEWQVPSGYTGWQALTAPVDAPFDGTGDALLSNMWTQKSGSGTGYNAANDDISNSSVFDYDETASVGGSTTEDLNDAWFVPSDLSTAITQGQTSQLAYFFNDRDFDGTDDAGSPFTLSATGTLSGNENTNTDVDLGLTYTVNDGGGDADGWNLVGNPFLAPIDWELVTDDGGGRSDVARTVYIPKADGTYATYQAASSGTSGSSTNGGSRYLSPFQGFFVKATGNSPSLTVKSNDKALNESPTLKQGGTDAAKVKLRMRAEGSSRDENTVVRFAEEARSGANDGDAYQLTPLGDDYFYIASEIPDSSQAYEIQSLPPPAADTQAVPLELASGPARTYVVDGTLSGIPSDWTVRLRDRKTGTTADLTRGESLSVALDGHASRSTGKAGDTKRPSRTPAAPVVARASGPAATSTVKTAAESARVVLEIIPSDTAPIQLTQFEGTLQEDAVALSWATASKRRDARFHVQRSPSADGPWETLRVVKKSGATAYRVTDDLSYEDDAVRYRLKVEANGTTQYSDPITVERTPPSALRVRSLFPNPARSTLTIEYELPEPTTVRMKVYDVLGRRVATVLNQTREAGRHKRTIPVTGLSSGIHFLRLRTASAVRTRKFVVVR